MEKKEKTSNENKVKLPQNLGIKVWKILKEKYGIETRKNNIGLMDFEFTQEELNLITSLKLKNPAENDLIGISRLPNLKLLEVETINITALQQQRDIASIGEKDIEEIEKCTSLKSLSIKNQAKVNNIDISNLTNLEDLTISHNQHLEQILGTEHMHNLWTLECFGNNRISSLKGLDKVILQNPELAKLNLDVLLFPDAVGYDYRTGEYNKEAFSLIQELSQMGEVGWSEGLNRNQAIRINTYQMVKLHNKSCQILQDNIPSSANKRDVIVGIEEYLSQNVKYDYESMQNRKYKYNRIWDRKSKTIKWSKIWSKWSI